MVGSVPDARLCNATEVPRLLSDWMCDGFVINHIHNPPPRLGEIIARHRLPAMWLNVEQPSDCAHPDDFGGAVQATRHLLQLGHTRICYFHPSGSPHYSASARRRGFERAMNNAGLPAWVEEIESNANSASYVARSRELLRLSERPSAILCYELWLAQPVWAAALHEGLRVPEDLSLITFHEKVFDGLGAPFSTMQIPFVEMAREAVRGVVEKIADPSLVIPTRVLLYPDPQGEICLPPSPTYASNVR